MSPEEIFENAERAEDSGDEQDALRAWRELSIIRPEPLTLCRFAMLASKLGEYDEAERAFLLATEYDSGFALGYEGLGLLAIDRGRFGDAEHFLRRSLQLEPSRRGYCLLGIALASLGRDPEARQSYLEAIKIDPDFEEAYYNLSLIHI